MFVTYKNSKVDGYTQKAKGGVTSGGGWLYGPDGGGYGVGPCGEECHWDGGGSPNDKRATYVGNFAFSYGFCASSRSDSCDRQGYCALSTDQTANASDIKAPYATYTSSASLFEELTCVDGFTSTQTESENPYTKTAELACVTSSNSGKDIGFAGAFGTTTLYCLHVTPVGALSLYAGGPNFPAEEDGSVDVTITDYDSCGKPFKYNGNLQKYKTADPCPIYYEPDCESAYILSKTGNYITTSSKNIGSFSTASVYALSTDKAVEFGMTSGSSSPEIKQTFSYSNDEVKYTGLKGKESWYTNSYIWLGESGVSTSTYKVSAGGYEAGTEPVTLFYSNEVIATSEGIAWDASGPGTNPCCKGTTCTTKGVSKKTTDALFAGKSFLFTHSKTSTTQLGDYVAYQPTSIERKDHLAWGEFAYSTGAGGAGAITSPSSYTSDYEEAEPHKCESKYTVFLSLGTDPIYNSPYYEWEDEWSSECIQCSALEVPSVYWSAGEPGTTNCGGIDCGCNSASGPQTTEPGKVSAETQCYDTCGTMEIKTVFSAGGEPGPGGVGGENLDRTYCSPGEVYYESFYENKVSVLENEIERTGNCAIVGSTSYGVSYTHLTRAQTLTTGIGFQDGGFQVTLQKSEGLYYLDSKGSMQTATSYSLKQSKSDITDSHAVFAFSGAYYNPMGKTTQFGSDGAKKTFIALATGDAVYLVGSPDGKSKSTSTASHDGDVHSYYISDPTAKIWNQASWPGHGVVNGKITTGTFSYSFNTGAFANSYGGAASLARFLPGAKQTIVAHGGLNVISSKADVSEKSFKTTYSTQAFSTSFDSTFKGAWIAKAVPYTYVATKSVDLNPNVYAGIETNHVISINCPGCDFPQPGIPYPLIGDTTAYFIKGAKSLIYLDNADTYLWTHPAYKKEWGTGHAGNCEE